MHKYILTAYVSTDEKEKMVKKTIAFFKSKGVESVDHKILGDYGDVAVLLKTKEWLNIERKTISDFVTSYISGHLQDQCIRMHGVSNNSCVIMYGTLDDLKKAAYKYPALKRINKKSIEKMIRNIEMVYKTPVFVVEKEAHYFLEIMNIAETLSKKESDVIKKPSVTIKKRPDVNLLMQADRIGEKTALMLLKEFGTPEKVLNASREDLLKIKGVGDSTVADLKGLRKIYYEGI